MENDMVQRSGVAILFYEHTGLNFSEQRVSFEVFDSARKSMTLSEFWLLFLEAFRLAIKRDLKLFLENVSQKMEEIAISIAQQQSKSWLKH